MSVEKAIENKKLIDNIKQVRNVEGESLIKPITPESPLPYGWKQIDHPDLAGFAIHPDLVAPLKFVFDSGPGMTMQALGTVSQVVKRINVIGSFFHAKSLMEVLSSAKILARCLQQSNQTLQPLLKSLGDLLHAVGNAQLVVLLDVP